MSSKRRRGRCVSVRGSGAAQTRDDRYPESVVQEHDGRSVLSSDRLQVAVHLHYQHGALANTGVAENRDTFAKEPVANRGTLLLGKRQLSQQPIVRMANVDARAESWIDKDSWWW